MMKGSNVVIGSLLALLTLVGCNARITASLALGGKPFLPTTCRSGEPNGFAGVDLMDDIGARLRLVYLPDGQAKAFVFFAGADLGTEIGACGRLTLERQSSRINSVRNVRGRAELQCAGKVTVSGSVQFENCH